MDEIVLPRIPPADPGPSIPIPLVMLVEGLIGLALLCLGLFLIWRALRGRPIGMAAVAAISVHGAITLVAAWTLVWVTDFGTLGLMQFLLCAVSAWIALVVLRRRTAGRILRVLFGALLAGTGTFVLGWLALWITLSWP